MFYCQRCGRQLEANELRCHFCGIVQEREGTSIETKPCKQCKKAIPVNANFCPYCGLDQATLFYDETVSQPEPQEVDPDKLLEQMLNDDTLKNIEKIEINSPQDLENFLMKIEAETKKMQAANAKKYHIGKNESVKPGLIVSTKLMLKDMFKVNKRLGADDFFWGYLGMYVLTIIYSIGLGVILSIVSQINSHLVSLIFAVGFYGWIIFFVFVTLTAFIRRFHDSELPAWLIWLRFIPGFGEFICLLLALKSQKITSGKYTFRSKKRDKF